MPFRVKDGEKGPVVWEAKAAPFHLKDKDGLPTRPHLLIVARNVQNRSEAKYLASNAPVDTPLTTLLAVAFARCHVERCFEDQKTELGMDHFEVRNYTSLMRHFTLTAVSFLFLAKTHAAQKRLPELTLCQVRTAANAYLSTRDLSRAARQTRLEEAAAIITRQQQRNAKACRAHRKQT